MLSQKAWRVRRASSSNSPKKCVSISNSDGSHFCNTLFADAAPGPPLWIKAQRLDTPEPFGSDEQATRLAIDMKRHNAEPRSFLRTVTSQEVRKIPKRIESEGPLSIRDVDDDELTEKEHPWGSRKPSKRAMQYAFYSGELAISARVGVVKTYELLYRHFGWDKAPRVASERQIEQYLLDRALRAQGVVSLDSICYLDAKRKPRMRRAIETRVKRGELVPVEMEGASRVEHWGHPSTVLNAEDGAIDAVHILSPFDPLVIQRKRLNLFFDYEHKFEAYLPKEKRIYGYFGLPVQVDDEIVAVWDLKADREQRKLLIQRWTWVGRGKSSLHKTRIETALHAFEKFQFAA